MEEEIKSALYNVLMVHKQVFSKQPDKCKNFRYAITVETTEPVVKHPYSILYATASKTKVRFNIVWINA